MLPYYHSYQNSILESWSMVMQEEGRGQYKNFANTGKGQIWTKSVKFTLICFFAQSFIIFNDLCWYFFYFWRFTHFGDLSCQPKFYLHWRLQPSPTGKTLIFLKILFNSNWCLKHTCQVFPQIYILSYLSVNEDKISCLFINPLS